MAEQQSANATTYAQELNAVHGNISQLEVRHNELLDQFAFVTGDAAQMKQSLHEQITQLRSQLIAIEEGVRLRQEQLRKVSLLLSLVATHDEVRPLAQRVDTQQYEQYITREWFEQELRRVLK